MRRTRKKKKERKKKRTKKSKSEKKTKKKKKKRSLWFHFLFSRHLPCVSYRKPFLSYFLYIS